MTGQRTGQQDAARVQRDGGVLHNLHHLTTEDRHDLHIAARVDRHLQLGIIETAVHQCFIQLRFGEFQCQLRHKAELLLQPEDQISVQQVHRLLSTVPDFAA